MMEQPELVAGLMREFLATVEAARSGAGTGARELNRVPN
jgi:hypothetical protein